MSDPTQQPLWQTLCERAETLGASRLSELFETDPERVDRFSFEACGLLLDASKQRLDAATLTQLIDLARDAGIEPAIRAMFAGDIVNRSESRPAWHVALRDPDGPAEVSEVLARMQHFVDRVRSGQWTGHDGQTMTDVVNIGIGGSDLGPRMVYHALAGPTDLPRVHFVANVDPFDLDATLALLDPARTLVVITSKSFTTAETLANARAARDWLLSSGAPESAIARHFVAVSTNAEAVADFGIDTDNMFGFWDWVGGRFSLWSAVGLPIALGLGMARFRDLLAGAHAMDRHFSTAPLAQNLPLQLAVIGIWNRNFLNYSGLVIAPYAQRLALFPGWLQQLEMESNGKSVSADGRQARTHTAPAIWGETGTNAQHAYFQMLHQGTDVIPVDFILPVPDRGRGGGDDRGLQLAANCLAQAKAMMLGRDRDALATRLADQGLSGEALDEMLMHRRFEGDRPSSLLLLPRLDAWHLGALLAAYEHKTYVQGVIWGINSFDQWGVELGKQLAEDILRDWATGASGQHDASTRALMQRIKQLMDS